ncbi:hypothetical protein Patl1_31012 [Pistacia atlantica]|uniref:Uncharacterized protein n=1 Tax=Pistacia atlantica TaxID=434234 RepID=A0ACC1AB44_9ROSI|nr:hypothetical protein Patl1_31012 [Pistacia atlantica]
MDPSINLKPTAVRHVVAMPLPGRGHINPMMNLCKLIASKTNDILVTFVVTEEWLGFIGSDAKPDNLGFASIPNVIPSELVRGVEFPRFYEAEKETRFWTFLQAVSSTDVSDIRTIYGASGRGVMQLALKVSSEQMDEISAGLKNSGVRYLWVARGETCRLQKSCGDMGLVVPWCDQLKLPNSEKIVQDWKIGWRLRGRAGDENSVSREEIAEIVQKFMDKESIEVQEMRKRARKFREICDGATAKGGTSGENLYAFIKEISQGHITIE